MWQVIKSVLAAFFGVQKDSRRRSDFEHGKPVVFIVTGLIMALIMVGLIVFVATMAAG
ncbi:MAG TPA: DUF2970 domain-containing protein [Modicisalibacter sp.]|nr:DUF2970 domain-containing protein [Modicisalibacter sp.]